MAEQKFSETLFEALDIIINKRLESVQKDKTILCVVKDASKANEGEYIVSNASAKFTAYSENTNYREGQNVWVLVPEGDYNNEKKIIGKHAGDSSTPYVYVDPMETYADMTGPILVDKLSARRGLIANYSNPLNLFGTEEFQSLSDLANYTRMGIKANFQTAFNSQDVISGSYGLAFLIETTKKIATAEEGKDNSQEKEVHFYIPVQCDTSDMWGNPYAYNVPFTQSFCFDINQEEYGTPTGIIGFFYQNSDFLTPSGALPYKISGEYTQEEDGILVDPNIFVEDIEISFGYSMDEVTDDTVYLFTKNALTYTVNDDSCAKTMEVRCIYVSDDMTRYAINNKDAYDEKKESDANFAALKPSLRWYRYVREEGVSDAIAGEFWREIEEAKDTFEYTVNDLKDLEDERFKVILCYEPEEDATKRWASKNEYIASEPLIFTNSDNPYDMSRDLEQALRLTADEAPYGVYNLYKADYSANNNLDDSSDANKPRRLKTNFYTILDKTERMSDVTRVAWYIPKRNTMITRPSLNRGYENTRWFFEKNGDWNGKTELSDEEVALFEQRINDYYIIVEPNVKNIGKDELYLTYYIEPTLIKHWTNNTICASAYYHQRLFEGNNAHYELSFGTKGTNGTDYTLLLRMEQERFAVNNTNSYLDYPSAWTIGSTNLIKLSAKLFDANDLEVADATYSWSKLSGTGTVGSSGATVNLTGVGNNGVIIKCQAKKKQTDDTVATQFTGYLIVPARTNRKYIAMEGPDVVAYDSSGTNPKYNQNAYALVDSDKKTTYNNNVSIGGIPSGQASYYPEIIEKYGRKHLKPTGMYFHGVDSKNKTQDNMYSGLYINIGNLWYNPLLIIVDPYGNRMLNGWNGDLQINKDNNSILAAVVGAGRKEKDNTFTGLLLGDLPKDSVQAANKTGLLGYEHGEETYGIFDDGTMFLGKSSRAQLKFNGTEGLIQNAGYDYGHGIKIDFDGGIGKQKVTSKATNNQNPYIDMIANDGSQVYISTIGSKTNPFFKIKSPTKELLHIGTDGYYFQTNDYKASTLNHNATTGNYTIKAVGVGGRIDLATGELDFANFKLNSAFAGDATEKYSDIEIRADGHPYLLIRQKDENNTTHNLIKIARDASTMESLSFESGTANIRYNASAGSGNIKDGTSSADNGTMNYAKSGLKLDLSGNKLLANKFELFSTKTGDIKDGFIRLSANAKTYPLNINNAFYVDWNGAANATNLAITGGSINIGSNFSVNSSGVLTATGADIGGKITADKGKIGGWNIGESSLYNGNTYLNSTGTISGAAIKGSTFTAGDLKITEGKITFNNTSIRFSNNTKTLFISGETWINGALHALGIDCTNIYASGILSLDTDTGYGYIDGYDLVKLDRWNSKRTQKIEFYAFASKNAIARTKYTISCGYGMVDISTG